MAQATAAAVAPLPAWLGSPRITVIEVEVFVVVAAFLLFFQLIFGFYRRQSSKWFIQGGVWVAYTLSFPLITYTLGMMQSSPVKNQMYPFWAVSLLLFSGCTNSITAYDLDENKQWKKQLIELVQLSFYASQIFRLLYPSQRPAVEEVLPAAQDTLYCLLSVIMYINLLRVTACWMANFSEPSKAVADYMRDQADYSRGAQLQEYDHDPIGMKGYKYLVRWHGYSLSTHGAKVANYRNKLPEGFLVTIDMIWEKCNDRLFKDSDGGSQMKDVCLSIALFHLLKRRFFGINCYEAEFLETRDFVLKGLLADDRASARAFRIVEVELGFLHDFFFTKYAAIYENEYFYFFFFILKNILTVTLGVLVYRNSLITETSSPIVAVDTRSRDTIITRYSGGTSHSGHTASHTLFGIRLGLGIPHMLSCQRQTPSLILSSLQAYLDAQKGKLVQVLAEQDRPVLSN